MEKYRFTDEELSVLESLPQPLAIYQYIDKKVVTLVLTKGFCDLFGYRDRMEAYYDMDYNMYKYDHHDDVARIANLAIRFATEGGEYDVIYRTKDRAGQGYRLIHAIGKHVHPREGIQLAYIWYTDEGVYTEDLASSKSELHHSLNTALHERSIVKANRYDYLTGLPSMTFFFELAEAGKEAMYRAGDMPVFLYMDLNGMKYFNTRHSYSEGDRLLQSFAALLTRTFGDGHCCRIGADHFAVYTMEDNLENTLDRFFHDCKKLNDGSSLPVRIGIYSARTEEVSVSTACDRAKYARDSLRKTFESAYVYYNKEIEDEAVKRRYILSNLDKAISNNWIEVHYQPIIREVNGRVCSEEALARWFDPSLGFLSPGDFIPCLEDSGLIYKLDLYVVDKILEKIKLQKQAGLSIVPHSVNLSRSDFDACDMVEAIREKVDNAHVERDKIIIEITESIVSNDFDFMKEQIHRFRDLGFPVWMDDFGSGYSSMDVLQSIKFDLLKFDMNFMRKLDEGENGKIILTELMKMAAALDLDTVCEGVEREDQVRFLREIGCSRLQGFYYSKAIPLEMIIDRYKRGVQVGYENLEEADYYEAMGRVNLYDYAVIANEDDDAFHHFFDTLPMGIIEIKGDMTRFVRSNSSYRDFIKRFFHLDLSYEGTAFAPYDAAFLYNIVKTCCEQGSRSFYDEKMPDGSTVHSFARRIARNPVTGAFAVVIVVLSITEPGEGATYADIARALATDYYNIYYVDMDTEDFIEYTSLVGGDEMALERHGSNFFAKARQDTQVRIYEEDRKVFLESFTKENIIKELDKQNVFMITYRLIDTGEPVYANMKITRLERGSNRIIIGISIIDSQGRQTDVN